jgi:three-Cys-motif partner protein
MSIFESDFFDGKRPWSHIKDKVLSDYMHVYLAKVMKLGEPILLVDGFAGPGVFGDGSIGSPLMMCEAAERFAHGSYRALFINRNPVYHRQLRQALQDRKWLETAQPVLGDSTEMLAQFPQNLGSHTAFFYLDPFGLRGCEFATLEQLLSRSQRYSTEILLTLSGPILHRLAARHAAVVPAQ